MEFLLIASAHFLALLSPGPDFFIVMQTAIRYQLRHVISVCAGISIANGVYLAIAIIGLEFVRGMSTFMHVLQYLGSAYLVFLGIMLLKAPKTQISTDSNPPLQEEQSCNRQFIIGFTSGILNPKNIIFYLSIFTVMVSPNTSFVIRCLYGVWMVTIVFVWDLFIGLIAGNNILKKRLGSKIVWIEKFSGIMLTTFGILLCFE